MTTKQLSGDQRHPEARAAEAAETIAAEGAPVTARAVRERSGVRMNVAAAAAREWNEKESNAEPVPELPTAVQSRFDAAWREAVTLARAEFAEARVGWQGRLDDLTREHEALAKDLAQVEAERDAVGEDLARVQKDAHAEAATAAEEIAGQRTRADKAEARAEAVEAERDRLLAGRDKLLAERDQLRDQLRHEAKPNQATKK